MLQFQQQAEIVVTLPFTLPPSPLPHSTKTETKWNSELLNHNYIETYKAHHIGFCYHANYLYITVIQYNLERKELQNQTENSLKLK